jgi:hypothetical protein
MGVSSSYGLFRRSGMRWAFASIVIALTTIFSLSENVRATEIVIPFRPGERLTFQAKWSFIPAGEAVLEILPIEDLNGIRSYHFVMTAKTYSFIDLIYKVRDRIDAFTDLKMTHSLLYEEKNEGKRKKDVVVNFNWEKQEAEYSNFGEKRKPIPLTPGSFDPLSIFYAFRLHELEENKELQVPVTDGKKCVIGKAKILKREKIKVASGMYDTYLVVPELEHIGGVFAKTKDAKLEIWVTADTRKIPVKIKSKVVVGSFVGELISVETVGKDVTVSTH